MPYSPARPHTYNREAALSGKLKNQRHSILENNFGTTNPALHRPKIAENGLESSLDFRLEPAPNLH